MHQAQKTRKTLVNLLFLVLALFGWYFMPPNTISSVSQECFSDASYCAACLKKPKDIHPSHVPQYYGQKDSLLVTFGSCLPYTCAQILQTIDTENLSAKIPVLENSPQIKQFYRMLEATPRPLENEDSLKLPEGKSWVIFNRGRSNTSKTIVYPTSEMYAFELNVAVFSSIIGVLVILSNLCNVDFSRKMFLGILILVTSGMAVIMIGQSTQTTFLNAKLCLDVSRLLFLYYSLSFLRYSALSKTLVLSTVIVSHILLTYASAYPAADHLLFGFISAAVLLKGLFGSSTIADYMAIAGLCLVSLFDYLAGHEQIPWATSVAAVSISWAVSILNIYCLDNVEFSEFGASSDNIKNSSPVEHGTNIEEYEEQASDTSVI